MVKMKISLIDIIKEHFTTFKKSDGSLLKGDLIIFFLIPIVLSCTIFKFITTLPEIFINSLLTSFSILTPLLFGLLPMTFSVIDNEFVSSNGYDLINEFKANVLFTILLSLLLILILLSWILINQIRIECNFIIYMLFISIILHLFLILRRFNILINEYILLKKKYKNT